MEKVNGSNSQSLPLWERQKNTRGHRSSVDKALEAHRSRKEERESRIQERLNMVRGLHTQFFPQPQVVSQPTLIDEEIQLAPEANQPQLSTSLFEDAELGASQDNAIAIFNKERANPEEGPVDDMPKGSIVDYTV